MKLNSSCEWWPWTQTHNAHRLVIPLVSNNKDVIAADFIHLYSSPGTQTQSATNLCLHKQDSVSCGVQKTYSSSKVPGSAFSTTPSGSLTRKKTLMGSDTTPSDGAVSRIGLDAWPPSHTGWCMPSSQPAQHKAFDAGYEVLNYWLTDSLLSNNPFIERSHFPIHEYDPCLGFVIWLVKLSNSN